MVVKVAIDLALDRLFDYEVPIALTEKLTVGQLLSVPFGHREARGFAMAITGDSPQKFTLKPVTAIVDETPFFSPKLLELVKKVAVYTASPLELVLKAALPAAVLKRNAHARELLFVEPLNSGDSPEANAELSARQRWVYEQIVRLGGGWLTQLCTELKTTPATLRHLATKGLVTVAPHMRRRDPLGNRRFLATKPLPLNAEQATALSIILSLAGERPAAADESPPSTCLLYGITGSGKTEVYLQAIQRALELGRGAIVMVPEISLTPQTVQRFASRFGRQVAVLHSALSDGERYDEWHRIRSGEARVVIGPRSAVWAPVQQLGLIVVDEEHDTSYKQDETPRYHARDVAVLRGVLEGASVVLGSATPSLESWQNVLSGKYRLAKITQRAGAGTVPAVGIVEMQDGAIFSRELLEAIKLRLERGEQTILFLNRRGFSSSVACTQCGYKITCPDCGVAYTYHQSDKCLRCHICGAWTELPQRCPNCQAQDFLYRGIGTQRVEAALAKCFPQAKVLRMDADSTSRKFSHDDILGAFRRGEAEILVGTQMIAKGLDFPNVTLVGVLNADSSLNQPDFRAGERTYQLLSQVAGRAGRAQKPGEVIIQTHDSNSPVIQSAARGDFAAFAADELKVRRECEFPPFVHLAIIHFRSQDLKLVGDWATMYAQSLSKCPEIIVSEAMPSAMEKAEGFYRWQIVLRAPKSQQLVKAWNWIRRVRPVPKEVRMTVDIDAHNLL